MGRASKLKKENMKKANELLEQGHQQKYPSKQNVPLRPTDNVRKNPQSFVSKMNNLQTEINSASSSANDLAKIGETNSVAAEEIAASMVELSEIASVAKKKISEFKLKIEKIEDDKINS